MDTYLPEEIIEYICFQGNLSIREVLNFSITNKYYYDVITNNARIWKKIYFEKWPQFSKAFKGNEFCYCWFEEVKYIYKLKPRILKILTLMSSRFHKRRHSLSDSDFTDWLELYQEQPKTYYYLVDELMNIVNNCAPIETMEVVPITTPGNKTLQYYAVNALRFLRKLHLRKKWKTLSQKQQTLEKWLALIVQWCRPSVHVSWKQLATQFDRMADEVKAHLKMVYPDHPLFTVSNEKLKMWRNENINGNKYADSHCRQIVQIIEDFFQDYGYLDNVTNEFLETVAEEGAITIASLIILESVARRLGLKYEPIKSSRGYTFTFQLSQKYDDEEKYFDGTDMSAEDHSVTDNLHIRATKQIVEGLIVYMQKPHPYSLLDSKTEIEKLELFLFAFPLDESIFSYLADVYMSENMDTTSYIEFLGKQKGQVSHPERLDWVIKRLQKYETKRTKDDDLCRKIKPKVRPPDFKYAVGMVMNYYENRSEIRPRVCVICDWSSIHMTSGYKQPIYNVLFSDGSYKKLNEGQLEPVANKTGVFDWLVDISKHFSHAFDSHFVPNEHKEKEYPRDSAARHAYYQNMKTKLK